jgi:hypothetical protein
MYTRGISLSHLNPYPKLSLSKPTPPLSIPAPIHAIHRATNIRALRAQQERHHGRDLLGGAESLDRRREVLDLRLVLGGLCPV